MKNATWKTGLLAAMTLALLGSYGPAQDGKILRGEYFGQTPPGETAELFGAGMISTGLPELNMRIKMGQSSDVYAAVKPNSARRWAVMTSPWVRTAIAASYSDRASIRPR